MLPAVLDSPLSAVRSRAVAVDRVWPVLLFLGGFLVLGFVFGGQAHAATPHPGPAAVPAVAGPASPVVSWERQVRRGVAADAGRAERPVRAAVAATADAGRPVTAVLGTVQGVAHRVAVPVGTVIRSVAAFHASGHGTARPWPAPDGAGRAAAAEHGPRSAGHPGRLDGGPGAHRAARTPSRAPERAPGSTEHTEHPVEGEGAAHHPGSAWAALPASGVRGHRDAAGVPAAHGPAPVRRPSVIAVAPD